MPETTEREAELIAEAQKIVADLHPYDIDREFLAMEIAQSLTAAYAKGRDDTMKAQRERIEQLTADAKERDAEIATMAAEVVGLKDAIRNHRSKTGNDLCWENDVELWATLNDGVTEYPHRTVPPCEEFLANCKKYWESRKAIR